MNEGESPASLLANLSAADKDALIIRLWRDLQAERARSRDHRPAPEGAVAGAGDSDQRAPGASALRQRLQEAAAGVRPPRPLPARPRLALGVAALRSRSLWAGVAIVALAFVADALVGRYQQHRLAQERLAELRLRHAAFQGMVLEVVTVAYEADRKSYRLTMNLTNSDRGRPLYVMRSPVRVFEQVGLSWKEVPAWNPNGEAARVIKLTDSHTFDTVFEPNLPDWTELIPGYMHIRFDSHSLVSERSDPDGDIVDRSDRYYVYLKPHGADDEAIRQRLKMPGNPPVYMPMPPH